MNRIVMMALLVLVGCAPTSPPALAPQQPPASPPPEVRGAYAQANSLLMSTQNMTSVTEIAAAQASALRMYNQVLAAQPDFMDALNDKAWILATSPDPTLRQPKESLVTATAALNSLARAGMLRQNREDFAPDLTQGRMIVISTTFASALATNGIFNATNTEELAAAACAASADSVMSFVVESSANLDATFHTPGTADMASRAKQIQASFKQQRPLIGGVPIASLTSQVTRLR